MSRSSEDWEWGAWVIGDLADAVRRAADVLGSGLEPTWVTVLPPKALGDLPRAVIVVGDEHTVVRLRAEVRREERLARFVGTPTSRSWRAEVDGIDLTVTLDVEEPSW